MEITATESTTQVKKVPIRVSELRAYREEGRTISWIAKHYALTNDQTKRAMKQAGLDTSRRGIKINSFELIED